MANKLKFEVGKTYFDNLWNDIFTVKIIDVEKNKIGIKYENGTHGYIVSDDGNIYFKLNGILSKQLNDGKFTLVEPEKPKTMENNNEKLGQEPAFASACANEQSHHIETGMSKRFYAACAAMQGLLSNPNTADQLKAINQNGTTKESYAIVVRSAYSLADELLKQENE